MRELRIEVGKLRRLHKLRTQCLLFRRATPQMDFFDGHRCVREVSRKGAKFTQRHKEKLKSNFVPLSTLCLCVKSKVAQPCFPEIAQALSLNTNRVPLAIVIGLLLLGVNVTTTPLAPTLRVGRVRLFRIAMRHRTAAHATRPAATPPRDKHGTAASETPSLHNKRGLPQTIFLPIATVPPVAP